MKKIALVAALALMGGILFAQNAGPSGPAGPGAAMEGPRGMGPGADIDWKIGTVVTSEYKKVTGTLVLTQTLNPTPTFKVDGVEYQLRLPRTPELSALKNGDSITIEGVFTTVKADTKVTPTVHAFKVTVGGKEIDLTALRGKMDRGGRGEGKGPKN